jgi:hypothetical protein
MTAPQSLRWLLFLLLALLPALAVPPAHAAAPVQQGCYDAVVDGGFEQRNWWILGGGLLPAQYVTSPTRSGVWAVQMGNPTSSTNPASIQAYSTVRQTVTIPVNATSAQLTFWVWTMTEANPGNDRQEALLLTPGASVLSASPGAVWSELANSGAYRQITVDVSSQRGRTMDLTFSVYNDGVGGRTWMFVDDVQLIICLATPGPTATPTLTATPTPTFPPAVTATPTTIPTPGTPSPIPSNCTDIIANGGFEWDGAWLIGNTAIRPFYAGPPSPVQSGNRSMALGAVLPSSPANVASYSSIQQSVTLPGSAQTAQIRFWAFPNSNAAAGGLNRQELILLDPLNYEQTIAVLWRVTQNNNAWVPVEIDLTRFLGRTVTVYFNARNDGTGTRTGMYLDQVLVLVCDAVAIMPLDGAAASSQQPSSFDASGQTAGSAQLPTAAPMPGNQTTVISVGGNPAPLAEVTPGPAVTATATPDLRENQGPGINLGALSSPWAIILIISGIVLLAVVLALLFFQGGKEEKPPPP